MAAREEQGLPQGDPREHPGDGEGEDVRGQSGPHQSCVQGAHAKVGVTWVAPVERVGHSNHQFDSIQFIWH